MVVFRDDWRCVVDNLLTKKRYKESPNNEILNWLAQLQEIGFFDARENRQTLTATAGNVHAAFESLFGILG
ncbi:unnamed protein product [Lactuca virosa]|uniref:Uncharacterized protein n=1 Tax=Lactuca virosa TaxID=75947 RepID=A0AAU9M365_9ASTR|nr:unnamed protein product [Lactuca virosa]